MYYKLPISLDTMVDQSTLEWANELPEEIKRNRGLFDFLIRMVPRIYDKIKGTNQDPFYKIKEILLQDKLYYNSLVDIKKYYGIDLINFLILNEELCEYYLGYICKTKKEIQSALSEKKNNTHKYTLARILENRI